MEVPVSTCHGYAVAVVAMTALSKCHAVIVGPALYPTVVPVHYQNVLAVATRAARHVSNHAYVAAQSAILVAARNARPARISLVAANVLVSSRVALPNAGVLNLQNVVPLVVVSA